MQRLKDQASAERAAQEKKHAEALEALQSKQQALQADLRELAETQRKKRLEVEAQLELAYLTEKAAREEREKAGAVVHAQIAQKAT